MDRGNWKNILKIFIFYIVFTYTSAAIFMIIEYFGIEEKLKRSSKNTAKVKDFIENRFKVTVNQSEIDELMALIKNEIKNLKDYQNSKWKKTISFNTLKAWAYFVRISAATVGKSFFYILFIYQQQLTYETPGGNYLTLLAKIN